MTYSGRVQGVGFRVRTRRIAIAHCVSGTVRNCNDGTVELVVEGEEAAISRFLGAVSLELGRYIRDVSTHREPASDTPLIGFTVLA